MRTLRGADSMIMVIMKGGRTMGLTSRIILGVALCLLSLVPPLGRAAEQAVPRLPTVRLVAVEGTSTTYRLKDYAGKVVMAIVPAQSSADIQGLSADSTVRATLAAVDGAANRVKVVTQAGQVLILEMTPEALKGMQIGDTFDLIVPRRAEVMASH
jgi:hypothetical protein